VGQSCRRRSSHTHARSLSVPRPHLSVRPQPPAHVPRRGRAHDRVLSGHLLTSSLLLSPRPARPLPPAHLHPQSNPLAPSLTLRTRPDKLHRRSPKTAAVLRPPLSPYRVCGLDKHRRITRNSGHPSICLFPHCLPGPRSPEHFLRSRSPPSSTRGSTAPLLSPSAPEFALKVRNLPVPLIRLLLSFCLHNSSPELIRAAVSPPHRVPHSLVLLRRRGAHGRVR
jgi:hypothetical protein